MAAIASWISPVPLFLPGLGMGELGIIFLIVLIIFGPGKLPDFCRSLGEGIRQFKQATRDDLPLEDEASKKS
jgi:sec-independent protein translocase protein TatA